MQNGGCVSVFQLFSIWKSRKREKHIYRICQHGLLAKWQLQKKERTHFSPNSSCTHMAASEKLSFILKFSWVGVWCLHCLRPLFARRLIAFVKLLVFKYKGPWLWHWLQHMGRKKKPVRKWFAVVKGEELHTRLFSPCVRHWPRIGAMNNLYLANKMSEQEKEQEVC